MKISFIPIDYDYFDMDGKTYIKIYGRDGKGKSCCLIDETTDFFYILSKNPNKLIKEINGIKEIEKSEIITKNFLEKEVKAIKIFCEHNKMSDIKEKIHAYDKDFESKERDINVVTRYILEKKLKPLFWYDLDVEFITKNDFGGIIDVLDVDFVFKLNKVYSSNEEKEEFSPKVLAFDIETNDLEIGKGEILMISLVSNDFKKVLTWKHKSKKDFVEYCKNEEEMLEKFEEYIKKINPDIITGYFSDGFDLPYIRARAEKLKINLKLARDNSKILFTRGNETSSKIKGRVHIDLLRFIETYYSQYLQSETLSLNEVSSELLGEKKLDFGKRHETDTEDLKKQDWEDYFDYNLQDSLLAYKLFQKSWPDLKEFTRIVHEPLYNMNRYGMAQIVESYIIHHLHRFNEIIERRPIHEEIEKRRARGKYEGAFVLQPVPGLYEDLAFFDFTSYWPSIIVTFNLSKSTLLNKKEKDSLEVDVGDKKFYFLKKSGFFSKMLSDIIEKRKLYKQEYNKDKTPIKKARSNAFKLLANASYGYQGFFGARYYCPEASASATAISRDFTKKTIDKINKDGFQVIYSDTDSIAFSLNKKNKKETLELLEKINKDLPGIMEIDLEDFYKRGIWVTKRTGEFGAKKKYALIDYDGKIKIRGFETVRRDWCDLAREVQNNILKMILNEGNEKNSFKYVKEIIKKLKNRKIDKEELLIKTQLKKPISEYKSENPHVTIAKKMKEQGMPVDVGMLILYYVAENKEKKKQLVRERAKLPDEKGEYDIEYYTNHQILPAVENIFEVFNIDIKEIFKETIDGKKQKKLGEY